MPKISEKLKNDILKALKVLNGPPEQKQFLDGISSIIQEEDDVNKAKNRLLAYC